METDGHLCNDRGLKESLSLQGCLLTYWLPAVTWPFQKQVFPLVADTNTAYTSNHLTISNYPIRPTPPPHLVIQSSFSTGKMVIHRYEGVRADNIGVL